MKLQNIVFALTAVGMAVVSAAPALLEDNLAFAGQPGGGSGLKQIVETPERRMYYRRSNSGIPSSPEILLEKRGDDEPASVGHFEGNGGQGSHPEEGELSKRGLYCSGPRINCGLGQDAL